MPSLPFSTVLTANQVGANPLNGWQYEYVPAAWGRGAVVSILTNTTGAARTVQMGVSSGSQTIQERSPVQVGGTDGVIPSPLNNAPLVFVAMPGDRLKLAIDELAGATPTVNGLVQIEPA